MTQPLRSPTYIAHRAKGNPFYAKAVNQVPGYLEAVELHAAASEKKRSVLFPMVQWPTPPTSADADFDDYLTAYQAAHDDDRARGQAITAMDAVIGQAERGMNVAIEDPDRLFRTLAGDLANVIARVQDVVEHLKGADDPLSAIEAGVADRWRELKPLREEYDLVRRAQEFVLLDVPDMFATNYRSDYIRDPLADDTQLANLDTLLPGWRQPDNRMSIQGNPPERRPWPTDDLEQLIWMVVSPAKVWIPTRSQLAALHAERAQRSQAEATQRDRERRGIAAPTTARQSVLNRVR